MTASTRRVLEISRSIGKALPIFGNTIEGAVELAVQLIDQVQDARALKKEWSKLADRAGNVVFAVARTLRDSNPASGGPEIMDHIALLIETLASCRACAAQSAKISRIQSFFRLEKVKQDIQDCNQSLDYAIVLFNIQSHVHTTSNMRLLTHMTQSGFDTVSSRLSSGNGAIQESLARIENRIVAREPDDGEYRYYLYSDFVFVESHAVSGRVVSYRARERVGGALYTVKVADVPTREMLESMRRNPHTHVEQLIGYSRQRENGGFYVLDSGGETWNDLYAKLDYRHKTRLVIDTMIQINDIEAASTYIRERVPRFILLIFWNELRPWLLTITGEHTVRVSNDGRIILPFPILDPNPKISRLVADMQQGFPEIQNMAKPHAYCSTSDSLRWLRFRDSMHIDYRGLCLKGIIRWGRRLPTLGLCEVTKLPIRWRHPMVDEGYTHFIPDPEIMPHMSAEPPRWTAIDVHRKYVLSDAKDLICIDFRQAMDSYGLVFERGFEWEHNALDRLSLYGRHVAKDHGIPLTSLCAGRSLREYTAICYPSCYPKEPDYVGPIPNILYFIPWPEITIGPPHLTPGYLALDADGQFGSTIEDYVWNGNLQFAKWQIMLAIGEIRICMMRWACFDYTQLSAGDIHMMEEDDFWGERAGC